MLHKSKFERCRRREADGEIAVCEKTIREWIETAEMYKNQRDQAVNREQEQKHRADAAEEKLRKLRLYMAEISAQGIRYKSIKKEDGKNV